MARENLYTYKIACHFSSINTIETCYTGMKRKFCGPFGGIFKNCEKCSYEAVLAFLWQEAESAYADVKSNFKIRGYLRPIWPLTSGIWLFWFKNCILVVFFTSGLLIPSCNWLICHFCHLPKKCIYCFIGTFFTFFENIPKKPTKFPFHSCITCLCSEYISKMVAIFKKSVQIFSSHPV